MSCQALLDAAAWEGLLGSAFARGGNPHLQVRACRRSPYSKSYPLYEVDVEVDGQGLALVVKDLAESAMLPGAARVKPAFLRDPQREIAVYRHVLPGRAPGTARCHGTLAVPGAGRLLLVLERVHGLELSDVGDLDVWAAAARWLGVFHARCAGEAGALAAPARLVRHDEAFYDHWLRRARRVAVGWDDGRRRAFDHVEAAYRRAAPRLLNAPFTVVHGECYATNIMVGGARTDGTMAPGPERICPVDWETAGIGPGVTDLAALSAGEWTDRQRAVLTGAYLDGLAVGGLGPDDPEAALRDARLVLAVRMIGWFVRWTPPVDHARDWLAEAVALADGIRP